MDHHPPQRVPLPFFQSAWSQRPTSFQCPAAAGHSRLGSLPMLRQSPFCPVRMVRHPARMATSYKRFPAWGHPDIKRPHQPGGRPVRQEALRPEEAVGRQEMRGQLGVAVEHWLDTDARPLRGPRRRAPTACEAPGRSRLAAGPPGTPPRTNRARHSTRCPRAYDCGRRQRTDSLSVSRYSSSTSVLVRWRGGAAIPRSRRTWSPCLRVEDGARRDGREAAEQPLVPAAPYLTPRGQELDDLVVVRLQRYRRVFDAWTRSETRYNLSRSW